MGRTSRSGDEGPRGPLQPAPAARSRGRRPRGPAMTATLPAPAPQSAVPEQAPASPAPPILIEPRHWLAALAVLVVFFAPYQTLVQTVLTDDAVRKGLNIDEYDMTWQQVGYGVGILYGLFTGLWLSA